MLDIMANILMLGMMLGMSNILSNIFRMLDMLGMEC